MAATCRADGALPAIVARVQRAAASRAAFVPASGAEAAALVPRFQAAAALARAAAGLLAGFVGFLAVAVFFRAPMSLSYAVLHRSASLTTAVGRRRNAHATASWALLMASTVSGVAEGLKGTAAQQTKGSGAHGPGSRFCVHGAVLLGPSKDDLRRVFLAFEPQNAREGLAIAPALGATVGCWVGAWPMPLDWDKPWQACNTYPKAADGPGEIRLWRRSAIEQSSGRVPGRAVDSKIRVELMPKIADTPSPGRDAKARIGTRHVTTISQEGAGQGGAVVAAAVTAALWAIGAAACDFAREAERGVSQIPEAFLLIEHGSHRACNETWKATAPQVLTPQYK
eukprot:SM000155S01649  [mRNA]  locus=s155:132130:141845:+ [translate_table: standard]